MFSPNITPSTTITIHQQLPFKVVKKSEQYLGLRHKKKKKKQLGIYLLEGYDHVQGARVACEKSFYGGTMSAYQGRVTGYPD